MKYTFDSPSSAAEITRPAMSGISTGTSNPPITPTLPQAIGGR